MDREQFTTTTGRILYRPILTIDELHELTDADEGFCLACGEFGSGIEPDARRAPCDSCDAFMLYGISELVLNHVARVTD